MVDVVTINELIKEIDTVFKDEGFSLYRYNVSVAKKVFRIKIAVDKYIKGEDTGVSIEDCSKIAKFIKKEMEIRHSEILFNLEVSSPGAEREIKTIEEYQRFTGKKIKIIQEIDGKEIVRKGNIDDVLVEEGTFVFIQPKTKKTREISETINIEKINKANLSIG